MHASNGKSVFYTEITSEIPCQPIRDDLEFYLAWTTSTFPIDTESDVDNRSYRAFLDGTKPSITKPCITNKGGSVLRDCNFAPGPSVWTFVDRSGRRD